ncbi:MAG: hypothetical protein RL758_812 [Pseudomonadota bacterium]
MAERLDWIKLQPQHWLHWDMLRHGSGVHAALVQKYEKAQAWCPVPRAVEALPAKAAEYCDGLKGLLQMPWWSMRRWAGAAPRAAWPEDGQMDMLWANMVLQANEDPQGLIERWHQLLATDGFLMFSCLGPDTLKELRGLYRQLGWGQPMHDLTDMHDYGDMLVQAGFAEPVMDMERLVLTFATPQRALEELRGLGRNLCVSRPTSVLGRGRFEQLCAAMDQHLRNEQGEIALTFEIIYGHAMKPVPKVKVSSQSSVSLEQMRRMLASGQAKAN